MAGEANALSNNKRSEPGPLRQQLGRGAQRDVQQVKQNEQRFQVQAANAPQPQMVHSWDVVQQWIHDAVREAPADEQPDVVVLWLLFGAMFLDKSSA